MSKSEELATFQDPYYKGDFKEPHSLIRMSDPGKLWKKDFLKILKEKVLVPAGTDRPKDLAARLRDFFFANEDTLKKYEKNYDRVKSNLNDLGCGKKFFTLAYATMKEMQHKGLLPKVIIEKKIKKSARGKKKKVKTDRLPPII